MIPLFNRESLVVQTLESVLRQSLAAAEVIVVDDGSTDGSREAVARFGERVTLISNGKQGVQAARNAGMALARASWIALCDSDDLWEPTWLEQVARLRSAEPEVDFVFGNFRHLREDGLGRSTKFDDAPPGYWYRTGRRERPEGWVFDTCIAGETFRWHPIFPSATAFSKQLVSRAGAFDLSLAGKRNEDGEFTIRLLYEARAAAIPQPLVAIRKHGESVSSDQLKLLIDEIWMLDFVKQNHPAARPYHAMIDREIVRRTIAGANLAFVAQDHELARKLIKSVGWRQRPMRLHLKNLVSALPGPIAVPANDLLQRLAERQ
ncbi:MAG: glycosyltransferase [Alphaproteobacteria bacterium]|nr:glycosyltransferase [Alphaproteobacteria bacterium]